MLTPITTWFDVLELIEIEAKHGELSLAPQMGETIFNFLPEQESVRQIRQGIVQRHVRDLGLGLSPFGDVFMGGDPAAAAHGTV